MFEEYGPALGAAGGTLAIVLGAQKLGVREEYAAVGAIAVGAITAMNTKGPARQIATGVACAGVCVGILRQLAAQQAKNVPPSPARQADGDFVTREQLQEALSRLAEQQAKQHCEMYAELHKTLLGELSSLRAAFASNRERNAEARVATRARMRDSRSAPPTVAAPQVQRVADEPATNLDMDYMESAYGAMATRGEPSLPVAEPVPAEALDPALPTEPAPPASVDADVQPTAAAVAQFPPDHLARILAVRAQLAPNEWEQLTTLLSSMSPAEMDAMEGRLIKAPTVDDAVDHLRTVVLQPQRGERA